MFDARTRLGVALPLGGTLVRVRRRRRCARAFPRSDSVSCGPGGSAAFATTAPLPGGRIRTSARSRIQSWRRTIFFLVLFIKVRIRWSDFGRPRLFDPARLVTCSSFCLASPCLRPLDRRGDFSTAHFGRDGSATRPSLPLQSLGPCGCSHGITATAPSQRGPHFRCPMTYS